MQDLDLDNVIKSYLIRLSVDPTHIGYRQLVDCIDIRIKEKPSKMSCIYSAVASKYEIKPKSVMRNIAYTLKQVEDLPDRLSELLGFTVDKNGLHIGRVIYHIADLISEPSMFDFWAE